MNATTGVALNILREALQRRWVLVLAIGVSLCLVLVICALRLEVVNGALTSTRLFGTSFKASSRPIADVMRPLFKASAYMIFYGGVLYQSLVCAEFAPTLMSPGRIEHLLALPIRRGQLILGVFFAIWTLATITSLYGAIGLTVILGLKSGVWTTSLVIASLLTSVAWAAIYTSMLVVASLIRSTALSATIGFVVLLGGIASGHRKELMDVFSPGVGRETFSALSLLFPKVSTLADSCGRLAASEPVAVGTLGTLLAGFVVFTASGLILALWCFEQRDF